MSLSRNVLQQDKNAMMLRRMLDDIRRDCNASEATLWLISEDGRLMLGTLNVGVTPEILESAEVPTQNSLAGMVAGNGISLCVGPEVGYNRSIDERTGTRTEAMVAMPFYFREEIAGVVSAINPMGRLLFDKQDLDKLALRVQIIESLLVGLLS